MNNLRFFISLLRIIFEDTIFVPNIIHHSEAYLIECKYRSNAELESGSSDNDNSSN